MNNRKTEKETINKTSVTVKVYLYSEILILHTKCKYYQDTFLICENYLAMILILIIKTYFFSIHILYLCFKSVGFIFYFKALCDFSLERSFINKLYLLDVKTTACAH